MIEKRQVVFDTLTRLEIEYEIVEHTAIATIDELDQLGIDPNGEVVKNLFLCEDKKKRFFLISLTKNKTVNLKQLREVLDCRPLSFASESRLQELLRLEKGEVTPLGILNDSEHKVEVFFDQSIQAFNKIGIHPNDNTALIWLKPSDLEKVIKDHGALFQYVNLS